MFERRGTTVKNAKSRGILIVRNTSSCFYVQYFIFPLQEWWKTEQERAQTEVEATRKRFVDRLPLSLADAYFACKSI